MCVIYRFACFRWKDRERHPWYGHFSSKYIQQRISVIHSNALHLARRMVSSINWDRTIARLHLMIFINYSRRFGSIIHNCCAHVPSNCVSLSSPRKSVPNERREREATTKKTTHCQFVCSMNYFASEHVNIFIHGFYKQAVQFYNQCFTNESMSYNGFWRNHASSNQ